jgi:hypothetical protein
MKFPTFALLLTPYCISEMDTVFLSETSEILFNSERCYNVEVCALCLAYIQTPQVLWTVVGNGPWVNSSIGSLGNRTANSLRRPKWVDLIELEGWRYENKSKTGEMGSYSGSWRQMAEVYQGTFVGMRVLEPFRTSRDFLPMHSVFTDIFAWRNVIK